MLYVEKFLSHVRNTFCRIVRGNVHPDEKRIAPYNERSVKIETPHPQCPSLFEESRFTNDFYIIMKKFRVSNENDAAMFLLAYHNHLTSLLNCNYDKDMFEMRQFIHDMFIAGDINEFHHRKDTLLLYIIEKGSDELSSALLDPVVYSCIQNFIEKNCIFKDIESHHTRETPDYERTTVGMNEKRLFRKMKAKRFFLHAYHYPTVIVRRIHTTDNDIRSIVSKGTSLRSLYTNRCSVGRFGGRRKTYQRTKRKRLAMRK